MRYLITLLALLLCLGCQEKPTNPDAVALGGGRVEGKLNQPVPVVIDHAREVLLQRKLVLTQYSVDQGSGRVIAYTRDRQRVEVDVRPENSGSHVIVSTAGNEGDRVSMELLKAIQGE